MNEHDLDTLVDQLRATLEESDSLSADDRARLSALVARIEHVVDEPDGIVEHIEESVQRFEADHVGLVGTLNRIANVLSAGGI